MPVSSPWEYCAEGVLKFREQAESIGKISSWGDVIRRWAVGVGASVQVHVYKLFEFFFVERIVDIESLVRDGTFEPSSVGGFGWGIFRVRSYRSTCELCDAFDEGGGVGDGIVLEFASDFFEVLFIGESGVKVKRAGARAFEVDEDDLVGLYRD